MKKSVEVAPQERRYKNMSLRAAFIFSCALLLLVGCSTTKSMGVTAIPVSEVETRASILDGTRVTVGAYAVFRGSAVFSPHEYLILESAEMGEFQPGQPVLRCAAWRYRLFIGAPRARRPLERLHRRYLIVSGIFHNARIGVPHEPITFEYDGYLTDVRIERVLDEYCELPQVKLPKFP